MRLTRTGWVGSALIGLGVVPLICWTVWFRTRTWCPVDIPISLSQGSHFTTGEFLINLNARYEIEIESENKIPLDTLQCLLGSEKTCSEQAVLKVQWVLSHDGTTVQGTSDGIVGYGDAGPDGSASRTIGFFGAQKGRRYKLNGDVVADGSKLNVTNPRLRVSVFDTSYETSLVVAVCLNSSRSSLS